MAHTVRIAGGHDIERGVIVANQRLVTSGIAPLKPKRLAWSSIIGAADGLSQAEIVSATDDAAKTAILDERNEITSEDIISRLRGRHAMRTAFLDAQSL